MSNVEIRILLIEDNPGDFKLMRGMLVDAAPETEFDLQTVTSLAEGMACVASARFDVVLLDLNLPDGFGLATLTHFQTSAYEGPIIILSSLHEEQLGVEAVRLGAQDYLVKGQVTVPLLTRSIFYAIERWRVERELKRYQLSLEEMVEQRTAELRAANQRLSEEMERRAFAQAQLAQSEEKYRLLVDHASEAILVVADYVILFANPKVAELTGRPRERVQGQRFEGFIHPEDRTRVVDIYEARRAGKAAPRSYTFRVLRADGQTRWVDLNTIEIRWEARPAALYFLRDITDQRLLEEQVLQTQKMDAIGRLAGGIAHDFNNLLMVISGYNDIVRSRIPEEDMVSGAVDQIRKAVTRASTLTSQLLSFSRKQPIRPTVLNLNEVIRGAAKMLQPLMRQDVLVIYDLADELRPIVADLVQIEQVLVNLAANARDAMPNGGELRITTLNARRRDPEDWVMLSVRDTGEGMDGDTVTHIYEPFFTTKKTGHGTGLGLATVYGIVKQFGGEIHVESAPGAGTLFTLYFPAEPMESTPTSLPPTSEESAVGHGRILLVDDEPAVLSVLRTILGEAGYEVVAASRREEALELLSASTEGINVAIVDVVMPGMKIGDFVASLRGARPSARVVLISGYSGGADNPSDLAMRADLFLRKPIERGVLLREIGRLLQPR